MQTRKYQNSKDVGCAIRVYAKRRTCSPASLEWRRSRADQHERLSLSLSQALYTPQVPIRVSMNDEFTPSSSFNLSTVALSIFGFDSLYVFLFL